MTLRRLRSLSVFLLLAACHDKQPSPHVFASPPPPQAARRADASAVAPMLPLGTKGPGAEITSVVDAGTGTPASLTAARGTLSVLGVVALGPGNWRETPDLQMQLAIRGRRDTTLLLDLGSPPPTVIAHAFEIGTDHLVAGSYALRLRLVRRSTRVLAESGPVFVTVPER